jgi:hypothetical protein
MKKILLILSIVLCAFSAQAKINVVATLPDLGSLAREIGGDNVSVTVLAKPTEDPHFVDARPSFVVALRSADVLIDGGAELELGWLPPLLQNARNPKIEIGKPGRVQASQGVRLMNVPANVTRAAGDVHALGNPHFGVDPIIAKAIAQHIRNRFPQSTQPTPLPTTRTTRNSKPLSMPGFSNGARPCCRLKVSTSPPITIPGPTSATVSGWRSTFFWNRNPAFPPRHRIWRK